MEMSDRIILKLVKVNASQEVEIATLHSVIDARGGTIDKLKHEIEVLSKDNRILSEEVERLQNEMNSLNEEKAYQEGLNHAWRTSGEGHNAEYCQTHGNHNPNEFVVFKECNPLEVA